MGLDGEYGFAPANYIEITGAVEPRSPVSIERPISPIEEKDPSTVSVPASARNGPAAAIANISHCRQNYKIFTKKYKYLLNLSKILVFYRKN